MYKFVEIINNVKNISLFRDEIVFVKDRKLHVLSEIYDISPMLYKTDFNENIWIKDDKWENYLFSFIDKKIVKLDYSIGLNGNVDKYIFIFKNNIQSLLSVNEKKVIINLTDVEKIKRYVSSKESVFFQVDSIIKCLFLGTSKVQWQTDLSTYGEIRKIVGVVEDTLWVLMYRAGVSKDEGKLLGMDIITGNITIEINETSFLSDCFVEKIEERNTLLSIYGKISTKPADSPLIEIDALTGNIIRKQRIASLYQENLKIGLWKYLDGKIYFTASKDYINSTHIGILDYQTLELLWVDEVKERKAGLVDLQVTDTKIYVLDQGKQLHIYEKDTAL